MLSGLLTEHTEHKASNKPPLVWLTGWGIAETFLKALIPTYYPRYHHHFLMYPHLGTIHNTDTAHQQLQTSVEQLMKQAPPKALWAGWSLGGLYALMATKLYPKRVLGVLCFASSPCFVKHSHWSFGLETTAMKALHDKLLVDTHKAWHEFIKLMTLGHSKQRPLIRLLEQYPRYQEAAFERELNLLRYADLRPLLKDLKTPTEYILGEQDALLPHTQAELLPTLGEHVKIQTVRSIGHLPFLQQPTPLSSWMPKGIDKLSNV